MTAKISAELSHDEIVSTCAPLVDVRNWLQHFVEITDQRMIDGDGDVVRETRKAFANNRDKVDRSLATLRYALDEIEFSNTEVFGDDKRREESFGEFMDRLSQ